ncbi:MAG: hypothetical protein HC880_10485 [Bacteroidia bacterium]|nr:hypothetical protein [Bacteroidia bacterium]
MQTPLMLYVQYLFGFCCLLLSLPTLAQENQPELDSILRRVVSARVYHNQNWTVDDKTAEAVGEALAQFKPTYVSGLIYLDDRLSLDEKHIQAFRTIREKVLAQNPQCKFDFTLNPRQYKKPEEIVARMQQINKQLDVDIWYLDFISAPDKAKGNVLEAAIEYAHSQGQLIGGNELEKELLEKADFVAFTDAQPVDLTTKEEMLKLVDQYGIALLFQINNDSSRSADDTIHTFIKKWADFERQRHIYRLARNQVSWKYRMMYPVFFPIYLRQNSYQVTEEEEGVKKYLEMMEAYN